MLQPKKIFFYLQPTDTCKRFKKEFKDIS